MALSASVRATTRVGTPHDVGGEARGDQVADVRLRSGSAPCRPCGRTSSRDASWSSKWTPAAPASMIAFMISKLLSGPPKPASASATIGANQSRLAPPSACSIWSARCRVRLMRRHELRRGVGRIEALVGIHRAGGVGVGGDLPAGEVDRLQAGPHHLHGLVAGHRAQRVDERLARAAASTACSRRARPGCRRSGTSRAACRRRRRNRGARCRRTGPWARPGSRLSKLAHGALLRQNSRVRPFHVRLHNALRALMHHGRAREKAILSKLDLVHSCKFVTRQPNGARRPNASSSWARG